MEKECTSEIVIFIKTPEEVLSEAVEKVDRHISGREVQLSLDILAEGEGCLVIDRPMRNCSQIDLLHHWLKDVFIEAGELCLSEGG